MLDRLGEPEAIIAAETPDQDELPDRRGIREWAAIILLLVGGFIVGIGWVRRSGAALELARLDQRVTSGSERSSFPAASRPA